MTWVNQRIRPVMLNRPMAAATKSPADMVSSWVKSRAMATAAMAFIGWTGRGMPKTMPVKMLASPPKTRVLDSEIAFCFVRAIKMGRSVPMSPTEPEISARGC